jgi:hypothetical protein
MYSSVLLRKIYKLRVVAGQPPEYLTIAALPHSPPVAQGSAAIFLLKNRYQQIYCI